MEKQDIFLFVTVTIILAFSLYRRYLKHKQVNTPGKGSNSSFGSGSISSEDDYEPYKRK
jgi:hypothetical protein